MFKGEHRNFPQQMINKNRNQSNNNNNNNKIPAQQKAMEWNGLGAEGFCCHLDPASTSHRLSEDQVPEQPLLRLAECSLLGWRVEHQQTSC